VPRINGWMTKHLLLLPWADVDRVVQLLTLHNIFNYHESLICPSLSALCHFCWSSEETSYHLLCECPQLRSFHQGILGPHLLHIEAYDLVLHHLLPFLPVVTMLSAPLWWTPVTLLRFFNMTPLLTSSQDFYTSYALSMSLLSYPLIGSLIAPL
jgi:hypothetical protein